MRELGMQLPTLACTASGQIQAVRRGQNRYEISEEELTRLAADRDPHAQEIDVLRREVADLRRHVSALEKEMLAWKTIQVPVLPPVIISPAKPPVMAERETTVLPDGLSAWRTFAELHG